jgi:Spy/CpxP family protein refolding chaperone
MLCPEDQMTIVTIRKIKRLGLGMAALGAVALTLAGAAYAAGQSAAAGQGPGVGPGPGGRQDGFMGRGRRGGPGGPGMGGPGALMMLRHLDLTDAQETRVKEIFDSHKDEQQALGDKAFAARGALDAAVTADVFDESAVRMRAAEVASIDAEIAVARARIYAEVFQILTPEQQALAKKRQAEMKQRMDQRRANGPGKAGQAQ